MFYNCYGTLGFTFYWIVMMRRLFPRPNTVESIQIYTFWTTIALALVFSSVVLLVS